MRLMCLGGISRPDIMVAINILARHVTRWSANDDVSLLGYIVATIDYARVMRINDPPAKLWLSLYVDSDVGLSPDMKLTSGFSFIIALQGPDSFPVILLGIKNSEGGVKIDEGSRVCGPGHCAVWGCHFSTGS